jgi:ArsR family transcriptional regulator
MSSHVAIDPSAVAQVHHALADPTRVSILEALAGGEHCVCDLTGQLGVAQSRLSFHLKALRDAGLVSARRSGRWMYYHLNQGALTEARDYLADLAERSRALPVVPLCGDDADSSCCE